jgi:hypothetical protein
LGKTLPNIGPEAPAESAFGIPRKKRSGNPTSFCHKNAQKPQNQASRPAPSVTSVRLIRPFPRRTSSIEIGRLKFFIG